MNSIVGVPTGDDGTINIEINRNLVFWVFKQTWEFYPRYNWVDVSLQVGDIWSAVLPDGFVKMLLAHAELDFGHGRQQDGAQLVIIINSGPSMQLWQQWGPPGCYKDGNQTESLREEN